MTLDAFSPHVGGGFAASTEEGSAFAAVLTLIEAKRLPAAGENGRPFHLLFEGPADLRLEQGTYWLSPPASSSASSENGPQPIFLVPVGPRLYESIFN